MNNFLTNEQSGLPDLSNSVVHVVDMFRLMTEMIASNDFNS